MQDGDGVTIVDAGGGTVDVSSYSRNTKAAKETFEEVAAPQCTVIFHVLTPMLLFICYYQAISMAPSSSVSTRGFSWTVCVLLSIYQIYANIDLDFLADSPFVDDLEHIVRCFDKTTKLRFRKAEEPQYIKFGSTRDNDETYNIRFGQLKLMGSFLIINYIARHS